jgi:siroheme decarboxylase
MQNLPETEKRILNRIQKDWLICEAPFEKLAKELRIDEDYLIHVLKDFKQKKIIRDISAIFNAAGLGYESALIAFEVTNEKIENTASIINAHPGVSHNYLRDNRYNIWFTLTVDRNITLEAEAIKLAERSKAKDFLILKSEKLIKINAVFQIGENEDTEGSISDNNETIIFHKELSQKEKNAVCILQTDLPIEQRPFKRIIEKLNLDIEEKNLMSIGEKFKQEGIIRRYSAILKHTNAGYKANAMTAWKLKDYNDINIIQLFSSVQNISHLYLRTVYPGKWEHRLFAMIHAKTDEELTEIIKKLEMQTGVKDYLVLRSLKEFKKKRIKYFTEEF